MDGLVFVDTNVFLYALDAAEPQKQSAAQAWRSELWVSRRGRTSFQVLQEFYVKATHKWPQASANASAEVRDLLTWRPIMVSAGLLEQAWKIEDRYRFSFWDALIVAAAQGASCRYLLTEDLQSGQELGELIIVNPFRTDFSSLE